MIKKIVEDGRVQPWWYSLVAVMVSAVLIAMTSLYLSQKATDTARNEARRSEQKWCEILTVISDSQKQAQPTTESGKRFASEIERLRIKFDC